MITILGCYRFVNLRLILKMSDLLFKINAPSEINSKKNIKNLKSLI
jgi:hypothetical protein